MSLRHYGLGLALVLTVAAAAAAQPPAAPSLGEVARQAEAAKSTVKKAKKSYTNADLRADPRGVAAAPSPPPTGFMSSSLGKPVAAEEMLARSEEKAAEEALSEQLEVDWRRRAEAIRKQIATLQARLAVMNTPGDRGNNPAAQTRFAAALAKLQQGLEGVKQQWAEFEESARVAKVPSEWLDPRPPL